MFYLRPNRIGQGIEFDYCCVHAAFALRDAGFETIMVNCNPETVSTDYDTSDRLYFEPLTLEDVLAIVEKEKPEGLIVQFGGQTPLRLALDLERAGAPILGTSPEAIDRAEDRERFDALLEKLELRRPAGAVARSTEAAERVAARIGYPVLVRPSYVLGGRAMEIGVRGLMNVQYAVKDGELFVIEVNPRASRTVPFVSKAIGRPLARLGALVMVGKTLAELGFTEEIWPSHVSVKEAAFPFVKFPGADTLLSPEMRSTGEVMGIDSDFGRAYAKAQIQAGNSLPTSGCVLVSVRADDRAAICAGVRELAANGFRVLATPGTATALSVLGIRAEAVPKVGEGHPDVAERIEAGDVDLVINTVGNDPISVRDSASIRRSALLRAVPYFSTMAGARAAVGAIRGLRLESIGVRSLQEIHKT